MRALAHPTQEEMQLDTLLSALSDPVRRQIIGQLANASNAQACSAFQLPISKSTSTYHFRVLREAGLIEQRYSGTTILNTLRAADLEVRFPGLLRAILQAARSETAFATPEVR